MSINEFARLVVERPCPTCKEKPGWVRDGKTDHGFIPCVCGNGLVQSSMAFDELAERLAASANEQPRTNDEGNCSRLGCGEPSVLDSDGDSLWCVKHLPNGEDPSPHRLWTAEERKMTVPIILNGRLVEVPGDKTTVTYEQLVDLADMTGMPTLTVNRRADKSLAGFTLTPGQGCQFLGDEIVSVAHTGSA